MCAARGNSTSVHRSGASTGWVPFHTSRPLSLTLWLWGPQTCTPPQVRLTSQLLQASNPLALSYLFAPTVLSACQDHSPDNLLPKADLRVNSILPKVAFPPPFASGFQYQEKTGCNTRKTATVDTGTHLTFPLLHLLCVCVCTCAYRSMPQGTCGDQRILSRNQFSPTIWAQD